MAACRWSIHARRRICAGDLAAFRFHSVSGESSVDGRSIRLLRQSQPSARRGIDPAGLEQDSSVIAL